MPATTDLRKWRQEEHKCRACLDYHSKTLPQANKQQSKKQNKTKLDYIS